MTAALIPSVPGHTTFSPTYQYLNLKLTHMHVRYQARLSVIVVVAILLIQTASAQVLTDSDSLTPVLIEKENEMFTIITSADKKGAATMIGQDYITINADGVMEGKATTIETLDKFKGASFKISDRTIRVYGDIAVINGRAKFYVKGILVAEIFYTEIWDHRNGAWQFIGWQGTMTGWPSHYPVIVTIVGLILLFLIVRLIVRRRRKRNIETSTMNSR